MKKRYIVALLLVLVVIVGVIALQNRHTSSRATVSMHNTTKPASQAAPKQTTTFNKQQYSTTDPASIWVVVNKQHPLNPRIYAPSDLTAVGAGQYMRAEAAAALQNMLAGAATAGYTVTPASGYRSYDTQVSVYNAEVKDYGQATADSESARPGFSEHQTGLAMDLASDGCSITDCFGNTPGGKWVTANAYKYGFILRYPAADTAITGYRAETWHFRYVGIALATEMHDKNIPTLEQFFGISGGTTYVN